MFFPIYLWIFVELVLTVFNLLTGNKKNAENYLKKVICISMVILFVFFVFWVSMEWNLKRIGIIYSDLMDFFIPFIWFVAVAKLSFYVFITSRAAIEVFQEERQKKR